MERTESIYQINSGVHELDKTSTDQVRLDDLCFFRFIGGNSSETDELINELRALKEKHDVLIGIFRFPFRFEGKRRFQTATTQYFRMKEICDAVIYFHSDALMEMIDKSTTIRAANLTFNSIEEHMINAVKNIIEETGDVNIDFQDIKTFINKDKGPLFIHTVEGDSFDEPLKDLISTPYLPKDFTDAKQLIINIGYTRDVDMETFRQINLRLHDLFSKADLFKIGSYFIDEPGKHFKITLLVNGISDPIDTPNNYKKLSRFKDLLIKFQRLTEIGRRRFKLLRN
ncbi:cell division protein FtsZ [Bacillus oleivorans]|uniref:Cell division protein FtsZ n=1 Tax=Bacillus oleivorans TaxID=1448271 RepID=A0A285D5S3_9BACI|nr:cell division protein FtsZ [Bacillus oleivorans]SNX75167.1 cell division protein FtsZ [Bacillus oleivorans]